MIFRKANDIIGKEKEPENNLGDHGVRKYDYETGRFNSIDPLFEKYYGWSPYQYSMNNPIWAKDWNGKEVKVYSERIPASTLSKGAGNFFFGFLASLFAPRHTFLHIITDKVNVILEMGGPMEGTNIGRLIRTDLKEGDNPIHGRIWAKEHGVSESKEDNEYEFENKILELFTKMQDNPDLLPIYNGKDGPNSNSFIQYLIESNGGQLDKISPAYGQENTGQFYKNNSK